MPNSVSSRVRFAAASTSHRGAMWVVWVGGKRKRDVYVASRSGAGDFKVSLHESGQWRVGFTAQHMQGPAPLIPPERDRAVQKWDPPVPLASGITHAFTIVVPSAEVTTPRTPEAETKPVSWVSPAPLGEATHFMIIFSEPNSVTSNWPGANTGTKLVGHLALGLDGGRIWVVAQDFAMPLDLQEQINQLRQSVPVNHIAPDTPRENLRGIAITQNNTKAIFFVDFGPASPV